MGRREGGFSGTWVLICRSHLCRNLYTVCANSAPSAAQEIGEYFYSIRETYFHKSPPKGITPTPYIVCTPDLQGITPTPYIVCTLDLQEDIMKERTKHQRTVGKKNDEIRTLLQEVRIYM